MADVNDSIKSVKAYIESELKGGSNTTLTETISKGKKVITIDVTNEDPGKELSNKVDKVEGKALSSNDYTAEAKSKVDKTPEDTTYELSKKLGTTDPIDGGDSLF